MSIACVHRIADMKAVLFALFLVKACAFPNMDYLGKQAALLPFFNSVPGTFDDFGQTTHTIAKLTGVLPERQWKNESFRRTNLFETAKRLNLTKLVEAIIQAGIERVLDHEGPFTLFGPTNEAFADAPEYCSNVPLKEIIKTHVVRGAWKTSDLKNNMQLDSISEGRKVRINKYQHNNKTTASGQVISGPNNIASNGVLHVLSGVMCSMYKGGAIYELSRCPSFSVFTRLVARANLSSSIDNRGPLTLFAPVNRAFDKLSPAIVKELTSNVTLLREVLLHHIVPDTWYTAGMYDGQKLKTLHGDKLSVSFSNIVYVNNATIVLPDATVSNGVVQSVDAVLLPKMLRKHSAYTVGLSEQSVSLV
ncbi:transforming growth factor-beta-induced protein ig-h3-like [Ornithodoros turicata]|uniref:transforming growth factor-beta-induced protein ig-h3-like n=1 Tax=Ornithodoros turicata TaxID=34597 RepID=UPI00313A274B